jgi:hypothetical protein
MLTRRRTLMALAAVLSTPVSAVAKIGSLGWRDVACGLPAVGELVELSLADGRRGAGEAFRMQDGSLALTLLYRWELRESGRVTAWYIEQTGPVLNATHWRPASPELWAAFRDPFGSRSR